MKVYIIDDEPKSLKLTRQLLESCGQEVSSIQEFTNPLLAYERILESKPDLLLLDIEMPGISGFELIDKLDMEDINVVFVTAFDEYAIKAIKCSAIDYLLKPFSEKELSEAIEKTREVLENGQLRLEAINQKRPKFIVIPSLREYTKIDLLDIVYAEGQRGGYTVFYLNHGSKVMASKPLAYYHDVFDELPFFQIHKSHVINMNEMKKFLSPKNKVLMSNGTELDLAHRRKASFVKLLKTK